jgi:rare lipoprotein A
MRFNNIIRTSLILLTEVMMLTLISCASSTRFPSRHSDDHYPRGNEQSSGENPEIDSNAKVLESRVGVASYYSDKYEGRKTSSGEIFSQDKLTAAHPSYSMGTIVRVKNLKNRKTVIVRINDRMTNLNGRIIDLSKKAAEELDMITNGIAKVQLDVLKWGDSGK